MKHPDAPSHLAISDSVFAREHGEAFQSSGFRCRGGGIPGDLPLAPNAAHVHMCVSSSAVFSLSNFSHPGGFNGEFASLPPAHHSDMLLPTRK